MLIIECSVSLNETIVWLLDIKRNLTCRNVLPGMGGDFSHHHLQTNSSALPHSEVCFPIHEMAGLWSWILQLYIFGINMIHFIYFKFVIKEFTVPAEATFYKEIEWDAVIGWIINSLDARWSPFLCTHNAHDSGGTEWHRQTRQ